MEIICSLYKQYHKELLKLLVFLCTAQAGIAQSLEADLQTVFEDFQVMGMSVWLDVQGSSTEYHFGLRDVDRNLPVNKDTQYRIASISKSFTALGLLKLYDEDLYDLDDNISDYLPYELVNPNQPNTPITFRMVLSHQTGLQDGTGYGNFLNATFSNETIPNLSELLLSTGLYYTPNMWRNEVPGTFFAYSNINFGLAGTLIEAVSGERFDIYMKREILEPLDIAGSFNVSDLENINDVSVLYRFQNGSWQPQWDNYQGVAPLAPDLEDYVAGTNGLYFGPQGSLRATAADLGSFIGFIASGGTSGNLNLSADTLEEMTDIAWDYNGTNGDNYFGLFNRWGLGLHQANVTTGDQICNFGEYGSFIGHPGEAYGLVSDAYFGESQDVSLALLINGVRDGYQSGDNSAFYTVEEGVFKVLCEYFQETLGVEEESELPITIYPNPSADVVYIEGLQENTGVDYKIYTLKGDLVTSQTLQAGSSRINIGNLPAGINFIVLNSQQRSSSYKIIKN